jgi:hypothetical protein
MNLYAHARVCVTASRMLFLLVVVAAGIDAAAQAPGPFTARAALTCVDGTYHVQITWTESAGAQSYHVDKLQDNAGSNVFTSSALPATQFSLTDLLEVGSGRTIYTYSVRALNAAGETFAVNEAATLDMELFPGLCPPPPDAPVVSVTASCVNGARVSAHVSWTAMPGAVSYTLLRDGFPLADFLPSSALSFDEARAFPAEYSVRAILPGRTVTSARQGSGAAECLAPPAVLSGALSSCDSVTNHAAVHLSWTIEPHSAPAVLVQVIRRDDVDLARVDAERGGTYDDLTAVPGRTYKYVHRTVYGPAAYDSDPVFITTCSALPSAPTLAVSTSCSGSSAFAHLTWSVAAGATSYAVLRDGSQIGTATSTTFDDLSAVSNHSYVYAVRAIGTGGTTDSAAVPLLVVPCVVPHTDLAVSNVTVSSETPAEGELVTVTYSLSNVGAHDAAATTTRIRLGAGPELKTDDLVLTSLAAPPLAAGITVQQIATASIPKGFAGGTFFLFVASDDAHVTDDINMTNNVGRSAALQILAPPECVLLCAAVVPESAVAGKPVSFVAAAACIDRSDSVTWDLGDNTIISGSDKVSHTYEQPGTYQWTVHILSGTESCDRSGTIRIDAAPAPPKRRSVRH